MMNYSDILKDFFKENKIAQELCGHDGFVAHIRCMGEDKIIFSTYKKGELAVFKFDTGTFYDMEKVTAGIEYITSEIVRCGSSLEFAQIEKF